MEVPTTRSLDDGEPVAVVLARLAGVRPSGSEWRALCPTHRDREPSLTVRRRDDGWALVHCHAGCAVEDVVKALGLTIRDLFPRRPPRPQRRRVIATYPYRDEHGDVLYRILRTDPKGFRFEVPAGRGGWQSGRDCMAGVRRVLYGLPEVLATAGRAEPVYVVEGEKDADLMTAAGLCATTVAGGAGKWGTVPDAAATLASREVVVVADRDEAGWQHALEVAQSLAAVCARVRTVTSAAGNDSADHLAAGYGVGDLVEVDPRVELAKLSETSCLVDTFAIVPRAVIRYKDGHSLDDACVRLFAVVDEAPGRRMSGRNEIAAALGWAPAKVSTHAAHLAAVELFDVTDRPSGAGHKATVYRVAYNPARRGALGKRLTTAPTDNSGRLTSDGATTERSEVGAWLTTSPTTVDNPQPTAILSTMSSEYGGSPLRQKGGEGRWDDECQLEDEALEVILRAFSGAEVIP
jgi:hypothetical protein